MQKILVFATNNAHKVEEVTAAINAGIVGDAQGGFVIKTLKECSINEEIPEDAPTLQGNALFKAQFVRERLVAQGKRDYIVFADDTGLEVEALGGEPGVRSARYSGGGADENIEKLLREMSGKEDRRAQFRTAIALIEPNPSNPTYAEEHLFEGIVTGEILPEREDGADGFGYDPVFRPEGYSVSFANMSMEEKNRISHRGRAVREMVSFFGVCGGACGHTKFLKIDTK